MDMIYFLIPMAPYTGIRCSDLHISNSKVSNDFVRGLDNLCQPENPANLAYQQRIKGRISEYKNLLPSKPLSTGLAFLSKNGQTLPHYNATSASVVFRYSDTVIISLYVSSLILYNYYLTIPIHLYAFTFVFR